MKVYDKFRIEQWDGNTGNLIREYPSIQYTAVTLGMSAKTIRKSIRENLPDYRGYHWKRKVL